MRFRSSGKRSRRAGLAGALLALVGFLAIAGHGSTAHAVATTCGNPACTQVAGLSTDAFSLGSWNGSAVSLSQTLNHCVFSNKPNNANPKNYDATVVGEGTAGGAFLLTGPGGATLSYQVELADPGGTFTTMTSGSAINFPALDNATFDSCTNSGTNAGGQRLRITVFGTDMEVLLAGTYSGTLRLTAVTGNASSFQVSGTISVTLPGLVRLTGLQSNLDFAAWDPDAGLDLTVSDTSLCVWSNNAGRNYSVTATTTAGSFALQHAGQNPIPFEVYWASTSGVSTVGAATALTYATPETFTSAVTRTDCAAGFNGSLVLRVTDAALASAVALATPYTSALTLTVGAPP